MILEIPFYIFENFLINLQKTNTNQKCWWSKVNIRFSVVLCFEEDEKKTQTIRRIFSLFNNTLLM